MPFNIKIMIVRSTVTAIPVESYSIGCLRSTDSLRMHGRFNFQELLENIIAKIFHNLTDRNIIVVMNCLRVGGEDDQNQITRPTERLHHE